MAAIFSPSQKNMPKLETYRSHEFQTRIEKKAFKTWRPVDVLPSPAYDPFFSVESRANLQSGHNF